MAYRFNYWSCSRVADWVRGEKKPLALTQDEWQEWRDGAKSKRPFRYFLAEEVLDRIQNFVNLPSDFCQNIRSYWNNRFVHKTHFLKTGFKPGKFYELDERIIHGLFNELVEFVEFDLAHAHNWHGNENKYKFKKGRCPEAGLDHLVWASSLRFGKDEGLKKGDPEWGRPTPQAKSAVKMLELYKWWTEARPNRADLHDASGWSEHWKNGNEKAKNSAAKKLQEIEIAYDKEDEKMLVKLIKIRKSLWT